MNKFTRSLSTVLAAVLMLSSLTACDNSTTSGSKESSSTGNSSATENSSVTESKTESSENSENTESSEQTSSEENSIYSHTEESSTDSSSKEQQGGVVEYETNGQLVVDLDGHTWGISLYGGGSGNNYAKYVNEFKEKVGMGVNVFSMVLPTSGAYYIPDGYESYNASQRDSINNITNNLVNVINIDAYAALEAHKDEYIYCRTDHHWTPLGAYYASMAFCEVAQVPGKPLDTYKTDVIDGFVGTMYAYTEYNEKIKNDPDTFIYYIPSTEYEATYYTTDFQVDESVKYFTSIFVPMPPSSAYSVFMGSDDKIVKVVTANKNGRKLCVFKDSYGNATIPCYIDSFEEIYVCDVRYFDLYAPDFIKDNGITDVMFSMCIFSAVGQNAEGIKDNLLSK